MDLEAGDVDRDRQDDQAEHACRPVSNVGALRASAADIDLGRTTGIDLSFKFEITFVADNHDWYSSWILIFYSEYLFVDRPDLIKGVPVWDCIHQQEPFTSNHVLFSHWPFRGKT